VQRRHQKVIEEAPGPAVSAEQRMLLGEAAVQAARAIAYEGAGTVEFIAEGDSFYFMEMNTRLQVEHPVTEAITGLDLVEWQLRIAAGEKLDLHQDDIPLSGHAVEARIYAENPRKRFLPSTGRLLHVAFPDEVRVDAGIAVGDEVTVHYDPMLAKVIAHAGNRRLALAALDRALAATEIAGVEHNVAFLRRVIGHPEFCRGTYTTHLVEDAGSDLVPARDPAAAMAAVVAIANVDPAAAPWQRGDGFRVNQPGGFRVTLKRDRDLLSLCLDGCGLVLDGEPYTLEDLRVNGDSVAFGVSGRRVQARISRDGDAMHVIIDGSNEKFVLPSLDVAALTDNAGGGQRVVSPMPGQVISVAVSVGDRVEAGQLLLVVEAMKMEHAINAPRAGTVDVVSCAVGDRVEDGVELVTLED
jgi:3-methylcrotonyl-CoA carboxylase alpha subunit